MSEVKSVRLEAKEDVTILFAGDSGDGMQLTGTQFSETAALLGNDLNTFPNYPAEIVRPQAHFPVYQGFRSSLAARKFLRRVTKLMCWSP